MEEKKNHVWRKHQVEQRARGIMLSSGEFISERLHLNFVWYVSLVYWECQIAVYDMVPGLSTDVLRTYFEGCGRCGTRVTPYALGTPCDSSTTPLAVAYLSHLTFRHLPPLLAGCCKSNMPRTSSSKLRMKSFLPFWGNNLTAHMCHKKWCSDVASDNTWTKATSCNLAVAKMVGGHKSTGPQLANSLTATCCWKPGNGF